VPTRDIIDPERDDSVDPSDADIVVQAIARVRSRLDDMRRSGQLPEFPPGELERQFLGVVESVESQLASQGPVDLDRLWQTALLSPDRIEFSSSLPGGRAIHRAVSIAGRRMTTGIHNQVGDFTRASANAIEELAGRQRQMQEFLLRVHLDRLRALEYRVAELELEVSRLRGEGRDSADRG
jgi:hypothetical protein